MSPFEQVNYISNRTRCQRLYSSKHLKSYTAPLLFQQNENHTHWICMDYHELNKVIVYDCYPNPLNRIWKTDFWWCMPFFQFWNVFKLLSSLNYSKRWVKNSIYRSYEFLVMSFGVLAIFYYLMNYVLLECLNESSIVHLDEIIIYLESLDMHEVHLRKVLKKLWDYHIWSRRNMNLVMERFSSSNIWLGMAKYKWILRSSRS